MINNHPCILTIAGSDSGGGAGIQADLKTITVLGGFGMSAITALTAQNGLGVTGIHAPDAEFVTLQIKTVLDGFPVASAKTGMLFNSSIIKAVCGILHNRSFPLVVDPVCVSQSGHRLLMEDAIDAIREFLIPEADLLTPNRPEAEELSGIKINTLDDLKKSADEILKMGAQAVLIKGGHFLDEDNVKNDFFEASTLTDWLAFPNQPIIPLKHTKIATTNNHGTGCTLSAAIATRMGFGDSIKEAIIYAQEYLGKCLALSYTPGKGAGPVNHIAPIELKYGSDI